MNRPFAEDVLVQRSPAKTLDEGDGCWQVVDPEIEMKLRLTDLRFAGRLDVDHWPAGNGRTYLEPSRL